MIRRKAPIVASIIFFLVVCETSYGEIYSGVEESLNMVFSESDTMETKEEKLTIYTKKEIERRLGYGISESSFTFYIGKTQGAIDGYYLMLGEQGKHGPILFGITIDQVGKIKDVAILSSMEVKEKKINKRRFLRQFTGKSSKDPLKLRKDIDAVTGATISSNATTKATRKAIAAWEVFFAKEGVVQ